MINFNVDPYYDDFDPGKNFHRVLFRPGRAVQARELTQSQTILQNQISNFADHFFKQNTPIKGGNVTLDLNVKYLKLNSTYNDVDVVAADFLNQIVTDDTELIVAKVIATEEATASDPPTLVLQYFSGQQFANSANVISVSSSTYAQSIAADAAGPSSVASVSNGIFYIVNGYDYSSTQNPDGTYNRFSIGNFVDVAPQTIILSKYSNTPNVRIGLDISEYVSDYVSDPSLLDPAVGATNYQAPGADRYTIDLELTTKSITTTTATDQNFIELVRVQNGTIVKQVSGTAYSAIDDYFAKRTYETNGDYVVNEFPLTTSANTDPAGSSKYLINIGPGLAYVQGYRVQNQSQLSINANRARTTSNVNNNIVTPSYGSYFYVNTLLGANNGIIDATSLSTIDFHVGGVANVNVQTQTAYSSTVAAQGFIRGLEYDSFTSTSNTKSYVYKMFVDGITGNVLSTNVSSATGTTVTLFDSATNGKFSLKNNVYTGVALTIDSGTGVGQTRYITEYNGSTKTATLDIPFSVVPTSSSNVSLKFAIKDIECVVRAGTGTSSNLAIFGTAAINDLSKSNQINTGETQLIDAQQPQLIFQVGNPYISSINDTSYSSTKIQRGITATSDGGSGSIITLTTGTSVFNYVRTGATEDAESIRENFVVIVRDPLSSGLTKGDIVNFTNSPTRTVVVAANKQTATLTATDLTPFIADVYVKISITNADNTSLVLKQKTLVEANTTALGISGATATIGNTLIDLTKGQIYINSNTAVAGYGSTQNLYVSDVKRIVKIIDPKGATPTLSMLTNSLYDVTSYYNFDNGQRDGYYGHASISLKPGYIKPVRLWILFDYYSTAGGDGYYNKESYINETFEEIPSYVSADGTIYNLRDCIDFRPIAINAQSTIQYRYSVTPSTSNFYGVLLPQNSSNFTNDYSYYLGRTDLLLLTRESNFQILEGTPSINPIEPPTPLSGLVLAKLYLDPYTAYVPGETTDVIPNLSIKPVLHKNWQMKDITNIQDRLNNLEYYTALNLLEQNASSLQIQDSLGLNRFKNGILVDDFSTFSVADTYNADFSASINTNKSILAPAQDVKNYQLQNSVTLDGVNYGKLSAATQTSLGYKLHQYGRTNIVSLQYTETPLVIQKLASRDVDVNAFSVRNIEGTMNMTPPMDNWIDTETQPSLLFIDPTLRTFKAVNQQNLLQVGDWQNIPGSSYKKVSSDTQGYITTTTTTNYTGYTRNKYYGNYAESYSQKGEYVTNVSILPYIRAQQIQFRATNLLFNTTLNAFFDEKRVTRLIKNPNIVELTGVTGTFQPGDVIGYLSAGSFIKTGKVLDVYKKTSTTTRLYVVDDGATTIYSTGTVVAGTFNTTGTYVASTATGTLASSTHYSGSLGSTASSTNSVTLNSKASSTNSYYVGMPFYIVGGSLTGISSIGKGLGAYIGTYNGSTKVATLVDKDNNPITISYTAGDVYSIGNIQSNEIGNVSGVFYLFGGYFQTGERIFRLDNRVVTQTATEFLYSNGTETTYAEAKFVAQGLLRKTQELEFSVSVDSASKVVNMPETQVRSSTTVTTADNTPRSRGCCVLTTALEESGVWTSDRKDMVVDWCEKHLHDRVLGECFRRGYQVVASKIGVPLLRSENKIAKAVSKYYTWSWNNGTNTALGKKFNPVSIPNSLFWITIFMGVGAVVTKEYAEKTWKKLYK
jgi:hypothetical protein